MTPVRVVVLGGSGYIGGELVRLLLGHPRVRLEQVVSRRYAGQPVGSVHPNLRGVTPLRFDHLDDVRPAEVMFAALPHGTLLESFPRLAGLAPRWVDLSADHRLRDEHQRADIYGSAPLVEPWEPGVPELYADRLSTATRVSVPGCMATPSILALRPLADAGLLDGPVVLDVLTGSSGAGAVPDAGSHHAERAGAMRVYATGGHRHRAEICQQTGLPPDAVRMTVTAVEPVRGVLVKAHVRSNRPLTTRDVRALYAGAYAGAPFVRLVTTTRGLHRLPDPRWLAGSNFCDIGFAVDEAGTGLMVLAAVDNLVKGGAGTAVQVMNLTHGWDQREGLRFPGLHPV